MLHEFNFRSHSCSWYYLIPHTHNPIYSFTFFSLLNHTSIILVLVAVEAYSRAFNLYIYIDFVLFCYHISLFKCLFWYSHWNLYKVWISIRTSRKKAHETTITESVARHKMLKYVCGCCCCSFCCKFCAWNCGPAIPI